VKEMINAYQILAGGYKKKRVLVKHRCRWKDKVKANLKETGSGMWTVLRYIEGFYIRRHEKTVSVPKHKQYT
jgi:hypothetical protein